MAWGALAAILAKLSAGAGKVGAGAAKVGGAAKAVGSSVKGFGSAGAAETLNAGKQGIGVLDRLGLGSVFSGGSGGQVTLPQGLGDSIPRPGTSGLQQVASSLGAPGAAGSDPALGSLNIASQTPTSEGLGDVLAGIFKGGQGQGPATQGLFDKLGGIPGGATPDQREAIIGSEGLFGRARAGAAEGLQTGLQDALQQAIAQQFGQDQRRQERTIGGPVASRSPSALPPPPTGGADFLRAQPSSFGPQGPALAGMLPPAAGDNVSLSARGPGAPPLDELLRDPALAPIILRRMEMLQEILDGARAAPGGLGGF